ncbi:hypothetical protein [Pseudomonas fluorescens]|jgi:hypothetical protein|uniref:hypothetical protein n=1 Tax=Pseudomonas fluorescens TaxID=294 RepID=UPI00130E4917|nr:hypothetical protein [Pseudomonas fluorescens]
MAMLTEAKRKWIVCAFHACPNPEIFEGSDNFRDLQDAIIQSVFNMRSNQPIESFSFLEQWAMQTYWTYPERADGDILGDFEAGSELAQYAVDLYKLHKDGIFEPHVVLDLIGTDHVHPALGVVLLKGPALPLQAQAKLAMTCKGFRDGFGYDPFEGGHRKIESTIAMDDVVNQLALHAYRFIFNAIAPAVSNAKLRAGDLEVRKISSETGYSTKSGDRTLLYTNCLAKTEEGSFAVNFLDGFGALAEKFKLDKKQYSGRNSLVHAEIRHLETQLQAGKRTFMNVYVDKFCCTFCAIQYIVFGAMDKTAGAVFNTTLNWYTFSPYVVYFKSNRTKMWGADVERIFAILPAGEKLKFLKCLFVASKSGSNPQAPKINLSIIEDTIIGYIEFTRS